MKKMTPLIIAVISSLLAILAAWFQYSEKEVEKKEKNQQKAMAERFQSELIKKTESLNKANEEITRLQAELIEKTSSLLSESKTVQKIQEESIKFMTGDGIPTLAFFIRPNQTYSPVLYNKTKYPIYDIRFRIDNFDEIIKCKTMIVDDALVIDKNCIDKNSIEGGPFFMAPGYSQGFEYYIGVSQTLKHFRVQVTTRKAIFIYLCIVNNPNNYRIRVYKSTDDYRLSLLDEKSENLKSFDQNYWNKYFYADKKVLMGPVF